MSLMFEDDKDLSLTLQPSKNIDKIFQTFHATSGPA